MTGQEVGDRKTVTEQRKGDNKKDTTRTRTRTRQAGGCRHVRRVTDPRGGERSNGQADRQHRDVVTRSPVIMSPFSRTLSFLASGSGFWFGSLFLCERLCQPNGNVILYLPRHHRPSPCNVSGIHNTYANINTERAARDETTERRSGGWLMKREKQREKAETRKKKPKPKQR